MANYPGGSYGKAPRKTGFAERPLLSARRRTGGPPVSLISDLASELERSPAQIAQWITASPGSAVMSIQAGAVFCRPIEILDALLELYDGDLGGALHWLTAPNVVLSNERPVELLVTGFGTRAVRQAIRAIEYGLPV